LEGKGFPFRGLERGKHRKGHLRRAVKKRAILRKDDGSTLGTSSIL